MAPPLDGGIMAYPLADLFVNQHRAWRRGRALRPRRVVPWGWLGGAALALLGGGLIGAHALRMGAQGAPDEGADALRAAALLQPVVPGAVFAVPATPGLTMLAQPGGAIAIASKMRPEKAVRIDLCTQAVDAAGRLLPLRLGYRDADLARWAGSGGMRNVLLVAQGSPVTAAMPVLTLTGRGAEPLGVAWSGHSARWLGDGATLVQGSTGTATLRDAGWLAWQGGALQLTRRASAACPRGGELVARLYTPDAAQRGNALVTAFSVAGATAAAWLAPGNYAIPAVAAPELEDEALFAGLQARGLVRLSAQGAIELAPPDLPEWRRAPADARAVDLAQWRHVLVDDTTRKLLRRLYRQADGAYVRQQVALYNSERALLAWRVRAGDASRWQADGAVTAAMPPHAARLTAALPQGWQPWTRLEAVPRGGRAVPLTLDLPGPATGQERYALLLAGHLAGTPQGALVQTRDACDGRACASPADLRQLLVQPLPGARRVVLPVTALDAAALARPGELQYRHLRVVADRIVWQPLPRTAPAAPAAQRGAANAILLADRNGTPLWADGVTTQPAAQAGLAPLLGIGPDHASSVAGMLARAGTAGHARLSLDLPLQSLAQQVLDCLGWRQGHWSGQRCEGGAPAPRRKAGIVVLDAENGDILAAAGAGQPHVDAGNWREARDLDRASPADSPLRLPAWQHDGGAHNSPGSTFKVVSALGLELAARSDKDLDALLAGQPLDAINGQARSRGYDFTTAAPTYPASAHGAYVTNYREVGIDGRAQQGRLGLAQALTYSLNTWFAWTGEWSDRTLFGRPSGGMPDAQALEAGALDAARPIVAAARRLGFERVQRLDGGLLPATFRWNAYDALQATPAAIDPVHTRHELRQMSIGLRMQATPLQMALAAAAVGQGASVAPRLLLELDGRAAAAPDLEKLDVRLDRIRAGMKGVIDRGTAAGAFRALPSQVRAGLYGKTGTAPVSDDSATVWFTGWLEPGSLPGQRHRLAFAVYASHSDGTGGSHAAPVMAALLARLAGQNGEQKGNPACPGPNGSCSSMP